MQIPRSKNQLKKFLVTWIGMVSGGIFTLVKRTLNLINPVSLACCHSSINNYGRCQYSISNCPVLDTQRSRAVTMDGPISKAARFQDLFASSVPCTRCLIRVIHYHRSILSLITTTWTIKLYNEIWQARCRYRCQLAKWRDTFSTKPSSCFQQPS